MAAMAASYRREDLVDAWLDARRYARALEPARGFYAERYSAFARAFSADLDRVPAFDQDREAHAIAVLERLLENSYLRAPVDVSQREIKHTYELFLQTADEYA